MLATDLIPESAAPVALAEAPAALARAVRRALASNREGVLRVTIPVAPLDPLAWGAAQPDAERFFWHGRGEAFAFAGAGVADDVEVEATDALESALGPRLAGAPPGARYVGAVRFAPGRPPAAEWAAFRQGRFALPRFAVEADETGASLSAHLVLPRDRASAEAIPAAAASMPMPAGDQSVPLPRSIAREDAPGQEGWHAALRDALHAIREGHLQKVVLARRTVLSFDAPLDPFALLRAVRALTPGCFHVLLTAGHGEEAAAFMAATPERLFRVRGQEVETEAVAGTQPYPDGEDVVPDALLRSDKDRREHAFVRDDLVARLAPLTTRLDADRAPSTLMLSRGQHLYAGLRGTLAEGISALDLLRLLHPTPAVGGTPRDAALGTIARLEPFDRGLYAGPVGWISGDAAEFAVGIRSGLVRGRTLALYAGAGIVDGSDAGQEWGEVEHKIGDFARVLGLEAPR
ncbi:MAG TPA: isochorismate synthase [Rubricoccaceae bacterium]|nr:isochorismate synthase [Rubricoccaceae bacterium]